jgi:hypothetical protein
LPRQDAFALRRRGWAGHRLAHFCIHALHAGTASLWSAPIHPLNRKFYPAMRAETEKLVDEIKQGITLLRRHL